MRQPTKSRSRDDKVKSACHSKTFGETIMEAAWIDLKGGFYHELPYTRAPHPPGLRPRRYRQRTKQVSFQVPTGDHNPCHRTDGEQSYNHSGDNYQGN